MYRFLNEELVLKIICILPIKKSSGARFEKILEVADLALRGDNSIFCTPDS